MRISYSALETFKTCPLKYKYSQIDRIREPKSKEAVFGTIIHSTMNFIHTPSLIPPTLEQALDYFSKNWNSEIYEDEIEERSAFSQGISMIQSYYKKNNPKDFNIVDLESRFQVPLTDSSKTDEKGEPQKHVLSGIVDRIDKTEDGYEIIDYKTSKKMPSQENVDNNLQLSIYLNAFLERYPKEADNLDKIRLSLYFLKHGVKLSSTRTKDQVKETEQSLVESINEIEKSDFPANVNPLCDWCGYQKICPAWKHKYKEERKIDNEEINKKIDEYISIKNEMSQKRLKMGKLQEEIERYMQQEGVERVFGDFGIIAQSSRKTYKYDRELLKGVLEPLGKWEEVTKIDGTALKSITPLLSPSARKEVEQAKILDKETKTLSVKKK